MTNTTSKGAYTLQRKVHIQGKVQKVSAVTQICMQMTQKLQAAGSIKPVTQDT